MTKELQYEDVEQYLRTFSTNEPPYYFGGLLRLVLTGIDNLRTNAADGDIREHAHSITNAQAAFLRHLLEGRPESVEWFKDDIAHSSQTGQL